MHVGMGNFFQNLGRKHSDAEVWAHELALADKAEALGFDSIWTPEHHFSDYTMCPNVAQFLTWMAARTTRIKLGSMVMVLPWHDPVWVAEQFSVLDHMSGGRAVLGIGRGLGRIEFEGFRKDMSHSRQLFLEYAQAIMQGLETGHMSFDGELYQQPPVDIRPFPFKSFKGRVYASAISPESSEIMARLGAGMLIFAQKAWDTIRAEMNSYREVFGRIHAGRAAPKPIVVVYAAVHESQAGADDMYQYIFNYCASARDHYEFANENLGKIKGYEYYGRMAQNIAKRGPEAFAKFLADLQVWGTPRRVAEKLIELAKAVDAGGFIVVFSYGGMPQELARQNQELFAAKVLPVLQSYDAGALFEPPR